jgi:FKBP-type peptidyl-prolyl cis-trans isomerase FkpA
MVMNKMNLVIKTCAVVLFTMAAISGCKKDDPDASLKVEIERYVVDSKVNSSILYTSQGEQALIDEWLASMAVNKEVISKTSTGINYIVEKVGTGETVKSGNTVTVKYIGFYTNGEIFDASAHNGGTMTYVHKVDNLIKGWEEGIQVLQKGGRAAFLIPSAKGYGTAGSRSIPPYTPLIFVIEVIDIK